MRHGPERPPQRLDGLWWRLALRLGWQEPDVEAVINGKPPCTSPSGLPNFDGADPCFNNELVITHAGPYPA